MWRWHRHLDPVQHRPDHSRPCRRLENLWLGVIDYEKSLGMQWITVKCGDGTGIWTQFSTDLITRAHAAGLKIFGWAYAYGTSPSGEANVALNALSLGADGFIIDAESEYETLANNSAVAAQYCQAIRAAYPRSEEHTSELQSPMYL